MCRNMIAALILCALSTLPLNADQVDDYIHKFMERGRVPGVALAVIHNGQLIKTATYGLANVEWQRPVTRSAPFWLDSLTKLVTAVGVMQLVDSGQMGLDDSITKYLTDASPTWQPVTVRHLLAHLSGIKDNYWEQCKGSVLIQYDPKDIYAYAIKQPLEFKPGERFAYDNAGYYLAGVIIERVTGIPYPQWITEHVLKVAGMKNARLYDPFEIVPEMVASYNQKDGRVVHNRSDVLSDRGTAIAGWGVLASLDDMIAFDSAFRGGRLLPTPLVEQMLINSRLNSGAPAESGIGFSRVGFLHGHRWAFKGGQAGVSYVIFPEDNLAILLLTNMDADVSMSDVASRELARFFVPALQPLSALSPRPDPEPERTSKIRQAMNEVASGAPSSALFTPTMFASVTADDRLQARGLLDHLKTFEFLDCDKAGPKDSSEAKLYCYYRATAGALVVNLTFGLAPNGQIVSVSGQP